MIKKLKLVEKVSLSEVISKRPTNPKDFTRNVIKTGNSDLIRRTLLRYWTVTGRITKPASEKSESIVEVAERIFGVDTFLENKSESEKTPPEPASLFPYKND